MHVTSNRNHPIVWSVSYSVVPKFTSRGVEHRIRNLSQDIPRMCRDRASKLRFFKFFASNENERCLVHRPSIVHFFLEFEKTLKKLDRTILFVWSGVWVQTEQHYDREMNQFWNETTQTLQRNLVLFFSTPLWKLKNHKNNCIEDIF